MASIGTACCCKAEEESTCISHECRKRIADWLAYCTLYRSLICKLEREFQNNGLIDENNNYVCHGDQAKSIKQITDKFTREFLDQLDHHYIYIENNAPHVMAAMKLTDDFSYKTAPYRFDMWSAPGGISLYQCRCCWVGKCLNDASFKRQDRYTPVANKYGELTIDMSRIFNHSS